MPIAMPDTEQAENFARRIGSGKQANGHDDVKMKARPEIGNASISKSGTYSGGRRRSRRPRML